MANSPTKKAQTSPRLANGLKSFISIKVQGMNLRGTGQYDGFLWNKKEVFTTDYMVAVTFANFSWTVHLDFEQCKAFLLHVFPSKRQLYDETFPKIMDVDDDVFVLVNRKEAMEGFLQEVVNTMDFVVYQPLYKFLCPKYEIQPLLKKITRIQAFIRQFLMQSTMEERLLSFFRLDLKELLSRLKSGVKVALIPACSESAPGPLHKKVLYLIENPYEMGLSRLCLISYDEFFHTLEEIKANTDRGGLCSPDYVSSLEGVYLSDIAEIRRGMASHNFSVFVDYVEKHNLMQCSSGNGLSSPSSTSTGRSLLSQALADSSSPPLVSTINRSSDIPLQKVRVEECLSIISFERCLDIQLLDVDEDHSREWFIDMLSLLSIKSLMASHPPTGNYLERETVLRLRKWRRVKTNSSYAIKNSRSNSRSTSVCSSQGGDFAEMTLSSIGGTAAPLSRFPPPNSNLNARRLSEAQLFMEILCESIEIEEERFDEAHRLQLNGTIECNTLWLDPNLMRVYIKPTEEGNIDSTGQNENKSRVTRGINVDDISEVRPGKMSFACDGTPYRTSLCLVGSEGTVCLPVDSVDIRNALLRQFQSLVLAYRTPSGCVTTSNVFTAPNKKTENELPLTPTRAKPAERFDSAAVSSRRRSSFKCHYPEALPPAHGSGYTRRKSTPAGCDGFGITSQSKSLNADFNDILGEVNAFWMRKSETPFSSNEERPLLSSSLPSALEVPLVQSEISSPPSQNIFKKLFMEVKPSEEDAGDNENEDSQDLELPPPPASPTMSVESYVSDEDMEGYSRPEDKDANNSDEDVPPPEEESVEAKSSPIRRASAALFNVVRRSSLRRDSIVSDDGSVKPTETVSEQEKVKETLTQSEEPTTVIVGDLPIYDDDHADSRSASPTHSVESYQSDEEDVQNPANDDNDDGDEMEDNEDGGKKSAIRRASLKMFSLVRRMSSTAVDDDMNSNEITNDSGIVLDDEKQ
eukprot:CAMPEP_0114439080 /NCGR_PEP_ID=MMETSP0103-20121206/14999_1 /TAXON_ID=37642 ORGANISM="Paraphysomonas imperforata, Strain PA2" /NCGR_SAMPLE_ID=MMETSP0103 /ASSEMBLY_ACC=CAM_ASM_000201 /LENGTH=974 /DNA_ID=CAMNT_0001609801 /DNA_START=21 /DNA_END=2945 /DNA_ORIENTATION=-